MYSRGLILIFTLAWGVTGAWGDNRDHAPDVIGYPPPPYGTFFAHHPPEARRSEPLRPAVVPQSDEALMVNVPAGDFWMGDDDGFADERPRRRVHLKRFLIDKYEVTTRRFLAAGMRPALTVAPVYAAPALPVVGVSWFQAQAYCQQVGKRLPTEAEWEKAARGTDARIFPWGNFWDPTLANDGRYPHPVGSFPAGQSPYGARDMAGNVWEWVMDSYAGSETDATAVTRRVLRGGSWNYAAVYLRATYRRHERPDYAEHRIGFRCAKSVP